MFSALIKQQYNVVAKTVTPKMELEALADKMTDKQYVIFTKTQELKWDKDLGYKDIYSSGESPKAFYGYTKADLYNHETEEAIKKAKFAHVINFKPTKKNVLSHESISEQQAARLISKLNRIITDKIKSWEFESWKRHPQNRDMTVKSVINYFLRGTSEEKTKLLIKLGFAAIEEGYDSTKNLIFLDPKAFKVETVYRLDLSKKETKKKVSMDLTPEEKEVLEKYVPDLGDHTSFRVTMSNDKIEENISKMSDDDIAWHLLNSKNALELGDEPYVRNRFGFREICLLQLMNKKISKRSRTEIAEYMLDKAGVSFVGGPLLKHYISGLAKTGMINANILEDADEDKLTDAIYYGQISDPDELRKIDYRKYGYQLARNPYTPEDVLEKIVEYDKKTHKGKDDPFNAPEVKWSGQNPRMGGVPGKSFTVSFSDTLSHHNYPIKKLIDIFDKYLKEYRGNLEAVRGMVDTLWMREDLPKDVAHFLIKEEKSLPKDKKHVVPPYCFDEKEFLDYWKTSKNFKKGKDPWIPWDAIINHPHVPSSVLKDFLNKEDKEDDYYKPDAYNELRERGDISDKEVLAKVKKELKFEGPDLLKHFGLQAFLGTKGEQKLKFIPVPPKELASLEKEMRAATTHEDFTFEVVAAYNVDQQIHKDYPKMSKDIGNVKHGLYHGTSMANAAGILASGINVKGEGRTGQMFGKGFYLASSASKAAQYASDNFSKSGFGIVFKVDVALGKMAAWKYGRPEHDSSMYNKNEKDLEAMRKYAKKEGYSDYEVSRWHLTHDSVHAKKGLALQHDEYVVKSGQQINITEIIVVHKTPEEK